MENDLQAFLEEGLLMQKRSVRAYGFFANQAPRHHDVELLSAIRREERRHYYLLESIYEDVTAQPYQVGRVAVSIPKQYPDMIKTAICDKLAAIHYYEELLTRLNCVKQQELVQWILSEQKYHARVLASIYQRVHGA